MALFDFTKLLKRGSISRVAQTTIPETVNFERGKPDELQSTLTGFKPDGAVDLPVNTKEEQFSSKVSDMVHKGESLLGEATTLKILKQLSNDLEAKLEKE